MIINKEETRASKRILSKRRNNMVIETERLVLRPFKLTDAEDVFEYLHVPAMNCFTCMKLETLDDAVK